MTSATATALGTKVPPKATSGRFSLATPAGSTASSGYFFVPPAPYTPADVVFMDSVALGGSKTAPLKWCEITLLPCPAEAGPNESKK